MILQKLVADESVSMSMSFADACLVRMSEKIMKKLNMSKFAASAIIDELFYNYLSCTI